MVVVGLTGSIGAGKSTVARLLRLRGAAVVDADEVVRELQAPGAAAFTAIRDRFGPAVVAPDGTLDRAALAAIVFAAPEARADLERLVHPLVRAAVADRVRALEGTADVVVLEIPLLAEGRGDYPLSGVVVVDCPVETAVRRLVERRGMDEVDARRRVAAQATRRDRLALADFVVDNSSDVETLERRVDEAWSWMRSLAPSRAVPE